MTPFVSASGVHKSYTVGSHALHVLRDVNLDVDAGEMLAIVGQSGVGKSTLLHLLGGLDRVDSGTIRIGDVDVTTLPPPMLVEFRNRNVGFVFQFHHLLPEFDALENAEMPMRIARIPLTEARSRATELLERVGLGERLAHRPSMLSGGEQQRVAVARALIMRPSLLLADEPTGDLDARSAGEVLDLLGLLNQKLKKTIVMVTHDPNAARRAGRLVRLEKGKLVAT